MALTITNSCRGFKILFTTPQSHPSRLPSNLSFSTRRSTTHVVFASKKSTSRLGKFDSKNRRSSSVTTKEDENDDVDATAKGSAQFGIDGAVGTSSVDDVSDDGYFLPELPGDKPDFFEGPQWDWLGFVGQYLWAFGIVFALIACGIAVATYNEGATDFKETPAYKESVQSKELLEVPDESNSDVFESNPTEVAPSLE